MFEVYLSIERNSAANEPYAHFADPYNAFCRLANLVVVATRSPIGYARMIWPKPPGWPGDTTALLWSVAEWTGHLEGDGPWASVTPETVRTVAQMWQRANLAGPDSLYRSRINTALTYFQHSWRSHHVEQACLHLSVALEVLFAPHSQGETTHQISFNVAHFLGSRGSQREELYDATRKFYAVRSSVIHGGTVDYAKLAPAVVEMFKLLASAFQRILTAKDIAAKFESDMDRKRMFRAFLFS